jgi:formate-dependent nitrite reductase cytochrome c552 subunit
MGFKASLWLFWFIGTLCGAAALVAAMISPGHQWPFLIGETSSGHYQIELACKACHLTPFGGKEALQQSCIDCHGEELKLANDSHPAKKFNDPRNADRLEKLNAQLCLTCHREHKPRLTNAIGVTIPDDFCRLCHETIGEERLSHKDLSFSSCTTSGCHNYHDNRVLYEDFLLKHAGQPDNAEQPLIALKASPHSPSLQRSVSGRAGPLGADRADAPTEKHSAVILAEWSADAHARNGVNCSDCHLVTREETAKVWTDEPDLVICMNCHGQEVRSFTEGKHGMRLRPGPVPLAPMRPELARQPMKVLAYGRELGCTSCHSAHSFDIVKAQVEACLGCHDDTHSRAYIGSPHHRLWQAELTGQAQKGSGVSCASCHMPLIKADGGAGDAWIFVNHNQNDNLRPSEKMIRSICNDCHGLQFSLDALADDRLALSNYAGHPIIRVRSIDWARQRQQAEK